MYNVKIGDDEIEATGEIVRLEQKTHENKGKERHESEFFSFRERRAKNILNEVGNVQGRMWVESEDIPQLSGEGRPWTRPVSYTHLDVYKRQI